MKTEKIYLYEGRDDVFLTTYIAEPFESLPYNQKRKAILISPAAHTGMFRPERVSR